MLTPAQRDVLLAVGALALVALPPLVTALVRPLRLERPNFRGDLIPTAFGLLVVLWCAVVLAPAAAWLGRGRGPVVAYLVVIVGFGLLGFADDLWGSRQARGLRGHLRALVRERRLTTGAVKALGGLLVALAATRGVLRLPWPTAVVDTFVVALSANALNLLDLRPGRALAVFLVAAALLCAVGAAVGRVPYPLALACVPALVVYERDARARVMLGDTGSNPLGAALGLALTRIDLDLSAHLVALAALAALHVYAEHHSLSAAIEAHPLLRRLDALSGRR